MKFTIYDVGTGEVAYGGVAQDPYGLLEVGQAVFEGAEHHAGWFESGVHHELPPKPTANHIFNYTTKQWEDPRTLQEIKDAQWALIKKARTRAEYAGFTWDGSTFDSDAISQNRITGAVTLAQLSSTFTIDWTLATNQVRTLNQSEMLQVGAALGAHVQTQFAKGQSLRAQIDAATTQAEVEAVVW